MSKTRPETDMLGEMEVPAEALYGVHTMRALENFPISGRPVHPALIHAFGSVKLACLQVNHELDGWPEETYKAIEGACEELAEGVLDSHVPVDALQGGAGTSLNMNVNEVIANRALEHLQKPLGSYDIVSPTDDINRHQSTNDTFPTALRVAAIRGLRELQARVVELQESFQQKEREFDHLVKLGRTQLQDAVLVTLGREMGAYADALSRDRWRIYKCEERLRVVNLGGTAVGTGLGAPTEYIFKVSERLRRITGLGLARAEDLIDATQNADVFVEVSGILKALATNLLKIAQDLRLMSSGPSGGLNEVKLPARQAGSSIMPGKVNPVIPEAVIQAAVQASAYDASVREAASLGNLELNAFLPLIADALLNQIDLLTHASTVFRTHCIDGLEANEDVLKREIDSATATVTALVDEIGYENACRVASQSNATGKSVKDTAVEMGLITAERCNEILSPASVTRLGSR